MTAKSPVKRSCGATSFAKSERTSEECACRFTSYGQQKGIDRAEVCHPGEIPILRPRVYTTNSTAAKSAGLSARTRAKSK